MQFIARADNYVLPASHLLFLQSKYLIIETKQKWIINHWKKRDTVNWNKIFKKLAKSVNVTRILLIRENPVWQQMINNKNHVLCILFYLYDIIKQL